jgi:hypothetical protein
MTGAALQPALVPVTWLQCRCCQQWLPATPVYFPRRALLAAHQRAPRCCSCAASAGAAYPRTANPTQRQQARAKLCAAAVREAAAPAPSAHLQPLLCGWPADRAAP